jgi:hypothetical protein
MAKYQVKRPRHLVEIKRFDEQARVTDLPPAAAAHEAPELLLSGPSLPRRLLLERAEGSKLSLSANDLFHGGRTESADQLVLQVCDADVETEPFQIAAGEVGAKAGPLETAPEVALLCGVTETCQPDVKPLGAEHTQEPSYRLRTPDRQNGNALGVKIPTTALSERFERALVADPFNEHDRTRIDACGQRVGCGNKCSTSTANGPFGVCQVKSLPVVHTRIFTAHTQRTRWRCRSVGSRAGRAAVVN